MFVIGVGKSHINIPFMHYSTNEISLKFLFRYRDTWPRMYSAAPSVSERRLTSFTLICASGAIRLVSAGKIDVKRIVTARFPLERAKEAVEVS